MVVIHVSNSTGIMFNQRVLHTGHEELHTISCSQGGIGIGHEWNDKDYFDLYITPETMEWTATLNDTGDGTNWVSINPATGTGSEINMYANAEQPNRDPTPRSCTVTFSDDSSQAADLVLTITQAAAPV